MSKHVLFLLLAGFVGLTSCTPPPQVPPPNFRPNPPYPPVPVNPNGPGNDIAPPIVEPPPGPEIPTTPGTYPMAKRTANPNEVISPYEPYNVIDISGPPPFKSGQLARDPSNQKIFRVP
ncbi:MAG: hypothetical protein ABIS50_06995 [Luteolibacter sp.]|uniref:hypothetical protein n=1 Tax=Luteolibacter sp. TaxID=1962973 RepID=UPI0032642672